jgi:hypothetical protein
VEKEAQIKGGLFVIFKKQPKSAQSPIGEISPNLVTLIRTVKFLQIYFRKLNGKLSRPT